jgi:FAD/FMN-containing dehydrogenase
VSVDPVVRRAASTDWAHMSPILAARLPAGLADLVAYPSSAREIATAVALAHRYGVPVTPRGKGTGNYGQAIPLHDGLVLDTSRADRVLDVGDGWVRAEAGTTFVALEAAARATGQELALVPSTVGSMLGGFLGGGAGGTGSLENGFTWDGYVRALDVVPATDEATVVEVEGDDTRPMVHAYGTTGVIAAATVALRPLRRWTALLASFEQYDGAVDAGLAVMALEPVPRLMSLDEPPIVATYQPDPAMPLGRTSLRAVVDESTLAAAESAVRAAGGVVEAVRPKGPALLTSLSFNHTTHRVRKARPEMCHLQVLGDVLVAEPDAVRAVLPGTLLHLDGIRGPAGPTWAGMILCPFTTADDLYAGMDALRALDVLVDDPHTWMLSGDAGLMARIRSAAARFDPDGLLNPGKLA